MMAVALLVLAPLAAYDVQGTVSDFEKNPAGSIRMLVTDPRKPKSGYDRATVTIGRRTAVVDRQGRDARAFLRDGVTVGVIFIGPVAESYPVQATAGRVVILKERFDATGTITRLTKTPHGLQFVVSRPGSTENLAVATVAPTTGIFRLRNGRRIPASVRDIRKGVMVDLAYEGPVLLSMPPQGRAGLVIIR
ncbi:MAG: hypothetical protein ACO1SV_17065 [Fimbriimonas sp.]